MRIAFISARYPEEGRKGDQLRGWAILRRLAERHELSVVTASPPSGPDAARALESIATVHVCEVGYAGRAGGAVAMLLRGLPAQVGWMMPSTTWKEAERVAAAADVALVCTVRSIRGPLSVPVVLDHVDALSLNMRRRATGVESLPIRLFASLEARLLRRWERRIASWLEGQTVTSAEDAAELPPIPQMTLVPAGFDGEIFSEPPGHERDFHMIFTGNMAYPPNRQAAEWLDREVVPRVRERLPHATAAVVGRNASRLRPKQMTLFSDVPDLGSYLRRAKVAAAPLRSGTGSPNKVLEATAHGAALVTTPWVAEHFGLSCPTADTAEDFAEAVVALLEDDATRGRRVDSDRVALGRYSGEALARSIEEQLEGANSFSSPDSTCNAQPCLPLSSHP